ncbi:MAG: prolyl oligopeptidase family serine peptidase [Candidatus Eisenbacteria bacterium]|uniref:prolyl oligopeptidase n=1 Tax=Eiseniibacteriota bacterium TaxID=2212470 RepID=A0A948RXQ9_UNCEI|nr:prolyl oligopeptidase family serine peptidase [Candidatus Eisenbacteria bacterium]MBU1947103.1 prolyl oligopeptidase family serine peptidase [Candidatus Eisenbacteria bacterium]MBU2691483.1 prolyl oligopeptidase family serine peptidase [Candidatus Eisenbacteria bacterium]
MIKYPESPCDDIVEKIHGIEVKDPYRRLEDLDSNQTQQWIAAENDVTFRYLDKIPFRNSIHRRMTELWNYEKFGIPFKKGERYFFTKNNGLQNQDVLYWSESLAGEPKVLLDPNALSDDGTISLIEFAVSDDGKKLAYGLSASGSDWQEWRFMEVGSGRTLPDKLNWVKFSGAAWSKDGMDFYYSRYDEPDESDIYKGANYYHKLYKHRLNTLQSEDILIYEKPNEKEWGFEGHATHDGAYLLILIWKGTYRENGIAYLDLQDPQAQVIELLTDFDASYHFIGNTGSIFYFMTDLDAPSGRVISMDTRRGAGLEKQEIIPPAGDALQSVEFINKMFAAIYLHDAHTRIKVFNRTGEFIREIKLPGIGTVEQIRGRYDDREAFFSYTDFTTPGTICHYDMGTGELNVVWQAELPFKADDYETEQIFYDSKDGTKVPLFICHKKGIQLDGHQPALLYGYGGFNIARTPFFSVPHLVWMEMGGLFALANIRGGAEYGKEWHEQGTKLKKQNVFDDFIAAAEWLIDNKYTCPSKLAISGRSNGGLLIGACMTQRPDLFGACIPIVGVLDMLRFHKFTIGWAWTSDYGSPDDPAEFEALLAYSPYHNLKPGTAYPATLICTGDHDDRVFPAHSFKFAAALQSVQTGEQPGLIRIETKAGHGLGKPVSKLIDEATDQWAFLTTALDITPAGPAGDLVVDP